MKKPTFYKCLWVAIFTLFAIITVAGPAAAATVDVYKEHGDVAGYRFSNPQDIDVGPDGVIYVTDFGHHAVKAFKETGENVFSIANETGINPGQFKNPTGVARDKDGNIWVVDYNNHRLQKFTSNGSNPVVFGENGNAWSSRLGSPEDVVKGAAGNYWIADFNNDRVVVLSPQGKQINIIGTEVNSDVAGQINGPVSLDFDSEGFLWVVDYNNNRLQQFDSTGKFKAKIGSYGNSSNASIGYTWFVRVVSDGVLVSSHGHNVTKFDLNGLVVFTLGKSDGTVGSGINEFDDPRGIAVDSLGNIYVADRDNSRIQKFTSSGDYVTQFGGYSGGDSTSKNTFEAGEIYSPYDIEFDGTDLWILDNYHDVVQKFSTAGVYANGSVFDGSSDTTGGTLNSPNGLSIDAQGDLWISDDGNNRVREFDNTGAYKNTISTFKINGVDDQLTANVRDIVVVGDYLWVADNNNDRILKINTTDNTAVAFTGFNDPKGLDRDSSGNLWVADYYNRRVVQMDPNGLVMRAFSEDSSYDQNLDSPTGIVGDGAGGLWVVDRDNDRVLRYTTTAGTLTHKIGGYYSKILQNPRGIAVGADGSLWVTDYDADAVLHFSSGGVYLGRIDNTTQSNVVLDGPSGIALYYTDANSNNQWDAGEDQFVVVLDRGKDQVVKFKTDGTYVANLGATGYGSTLDKYYDAWGLRIFGQEVFVADSNNDRVKVLSPDGLYKRAYTTDGGAFGKFDNPVGIAANKTSGSIWVADRDNDRLHELRKNTEDVWEFYRTVGGPNNGLFWNPHNIYVDASGNVWVSDLDSDIVVKLDSEGNRLKILGDAQQAGGSFNKPGFVIGMSDGSMWVTDTENDRVVHLDSNGNLLTPIGEAGAGNGQFNSPQGIAFSGSSVYVADTLNDRIQKFSTSTGQFEGVIGGFGTDDGTFNDPAGLVFDSQNQLWVVERANNRVQVLDTSGVYQSKITPNPSFKNPFGIAIDLDGNIWVADTDNNWVRKFDSEGASLLNLGKTDKTYGSGEGEFKYPHGVAVDSAGRVHVADTNNSRVQVFDTDGNFQYAYGGLYYPRGLSIVGGKVYVADTNNGRVAVFNENGAFLAEVKDNGAAETGFYNPRGISMDSSGNLWVADSGNDRVVKIDSTGKVIKKVTQLLDNPIGVQVDSSDNVWVSSYNNHRVIKYDSSGKLLKVYDNAGEVFDKLNNPLDMLFYQNNLFLVDSYNHRIVVQDGQGNTMRTFGVKGNEPGLLNYPWGIAVGPGGNLWISQSESHKITVFTPEGEFVKVIGSDGSLTGMFKDPRGLSFDAQGNLWVTDGSNHRLQQFASDGQLLKTVGTYGSGQGQLYNPQDLAIDSQGRIYVCDYSNHRIAVFDSSGQFLFSFGKVGTNTLSGPRNIAIDADGRIWIATTGNDNLMVFDLNGNFLFKAGQYGAETGQFNDPGGVALDAAGLVWAADKNNHRLQTFDLGSPESLGSGLFHRNWRYGSPPDYVVDVVPASQVFFEIYGSYTFGSSTGSGNVEGFVDVAWTSSDESVASVDTSGKVTAIAQGSTEIQAQVGDQTLTSTVTVWADNALGVMVLGSQGGNQGEYDNPTVLHVSEDKLYVADRDNRRIKVLDLKGNILQVIYNPDLLWNVNGMAVDADGNIYVADIQTDKVHKFDSSGNHLLSMGEPGSAAGQFNDPMGISLDGDGNLWIVDRKNHRLQKFAAGGTYLDGFGTYGSEDEKLNYPEDVAVDSDGNLWVVDNYHLKKFNPDGTFLTKIESIYTRRLWIDADGDIWVLCNDGKIRKYDPDLTELMVYDYTVNTSEIWDAPGKFDNPQGVAVDPSGHLWVTDYDNHRLQRISFITGSLALSSSKTVVKDTQQVTATATYLVSDGVTPSENVSGQAAWSVDDETQAAVVKGLVTALKTGQATVTALFAGFDDSLTLDLMKFYSVEVSGNTGFDTSSSLTAGKSVKGTVNSSEEDYFIFTPDQAGYYRVLFSSSQDQSGATLNIYDAGQEKIYYNGVSGGGMAIPVFLDAQDYYIKVSGSYQSQNEQYLVACLLTQAGDQDQEVSLQIPGSKSGSVFANSAVYYMLDLQGPRQLKVSYSTGSTMADVKITVYPEEISADTVLDRLISTDGENLESNIGLAQGKYYLEVRATAPGDTGYSSSYGDIDDWPYTLSVQPAIFETAGEYETNNTPPFANSLEDGVAVTARNYSNQDKDYYTFHYSPDLETDYLVFNFAPQDDQGSHTIQILNLEEDQINYFTASNGNSVTDEINLKSGQYYLLVKDQYSNRTEYLFSLSGKISPVKKVTGINLVLGKDKGDIQVGDAVSLTAQVFYSDGSVEQDPVDLSLTSTDPDVLSVTAGQVEVIKAGSGSIIASYEGKVGTVDLSIGVGQQQNYGNLIIVAGGGVGAENKLKDITQYLSDLTYLKFKGRGFEDEDIYYLNPESFKDLDGNGFNDGIVDNTEVTNDNFAWAVTTWAKNYTSSGPLYIYLNDHGSKKAEFQLFPGQILTGVVFNELLNTFQATGRSVVVIIEACHSGTFVAPLQAGNRVIITSADEGLAYLGDGGSSSFSQFFMGALYKGADFDKAFDDALIELDSLGKPYDGMYPQKYPQDLAVLDLYVVGDFALAPLFPEVSGVVLPGSYDLAQGGGYEIQAEVTGVTGGKVWATIKPANYSPPAVSEDFETPDIQVPSVSLTDADSQGVLDDTFNATYDFTCNNTYDVIIFARDDEGNIAQSAINTVSVYGGEDCAGEGSVDLVTASGWSLLSSRIGFNVTDKLSNGSKFVSAWKWEGGGWAVYLPDQDTAAYANSKGFSVLSTINPGEGFWVNSVGSEPLSIAGTPADGSLSLTDGWNLVGLKSEQGKSITALISGNEANIVSVWKWDSGTWAVYLPGEGDGGAAYAAGKGFNELSLIEPGEGFWVNINQQITLD